MINENNLVSGVGSATLPDYIINQQQALRNVSGDTVQAGLQFMEMFSALAKRQLEQATTQLAELSQEAEPFSAEATEEEPPKPAPKSATTQSPNNPSAAEGRDKSPIAPLDPQSEVKQALDMLKIDENQLTAKDLKLLQLMVNFAPAGGSPNMANQSGRELPFLSYRSMGFSKGLTEALEQAYKSQRPVRVDLNDNAAVILRLGKNGKVSAEFLTADTASHMYFVQNLQDLKNRLESKNLPYGELLVRDQRQDNQQQKRQQDDQQHDG